MLIKIFNLAVKNAGFISKCMLYRKEYTLPLNMKYTFVQMTSMGSSPHYHPILQYIFKNIELYSTSGCTNFVFKSLSQIAPAERPINKHFE